MQMQKIGLAAGATQVPGGNAFQFFPIQVGGPTPYARSRRLIFVGVNVYILLMAIMAFVEFMNFLSGIIMSLAVLAALLAFKEDMNVTYVCWWGVFCTAGAIAGLVGALIGFAVKISTIVIKFNIPLSCAFGMILAWFLYADYEAEHPESNDMVASWLRAFGLLKPKPIVNPLAGSMANLESKLPMFGGFGAFKDQANQGMNQANQGMAQANQGMAQANQYGATANQQFATIQPGMMGQQGQQGQPGMMAQAEGGMAGFGGMFGAGAAAGAGAAGAAMPAVPQGAQTGQRDVRRDPFLTQ